MSRKNSSKNRVYGNYGGSQKPNHGNGAKKVFAGVLFMAACFLSVYVLMEYHNYLWLVGMMFLVLMITAYFFLGQLFSNTEEQIDDLVRAQEALEAVKEEDRKAADDAFKKQVEEQIKSMDRTTRAMFVAMKKSADAQAQAFSAMESKIDKVIDEQNAGIKTVIRYNKENARQVAQSSKEALEKMSSDLTDELRSQSKNAPQVQYVQAPVAQPVYEAPVYEEPAYEAPAYEEPAYEEPAAEPEVIETEAPDIEIPNIEVPDIEVPDAEVPAIEVPDLEIPDIEIPDDETPDIEVPDIEVPDIEVPDLEIPDIEVPEEPAAPASASNNGMMTQDEIEAMLAGMNAGAADTAESEPEPEPEAPASSGLLTEDEIAAMLSGAMDDEEEAVEAEEAKPASEVDLAAATGIDLSDPNASLSPDDIAKLFAAAGN